MTSLDQDIYPKLTMGLHLPTFLLLVTVVTATDPLLFQRLCSDGECPPGWRNIDGDCAMFVSGWDEATARDVCRKQMAEYVEYEMEVASAKPHTVPVCLVRRETQCECGRRNKETRKIANGVIAEKNEFTWQGKLLISQQYKFLIFSFSPNHKQKRRFF